MTVPVSLEKKREVAKIKVHLLRILNKLNYENAHSRKGPKILDKALSSGVYTL